MEFNVDEETSVRDYLKVVFKYKVVMIVSIIIIMSVVLLNLHLRAQYKYIASVTMMITGFAEVDVDFYQKTRQHPRTMINYYVQIIKSRAVLERVVKALKLDQRPIDEELQYLTGLNAALAKRRINAFKLQIEEMDQAQRKAAFLGRAIGNLQSNVTTAYEEGSSIFTIYVKDINPGVPVRIANSVSRSLIIYNLELQIAELKLKYGEKHSIISQLQYYVEELGKTLDGKQLPDMEALGPASLKVIEQARTSSPLGGASYTKLIVALLASIFFSFLLAFIFNFLDQSFKSPHDVERFLNLPVISSIPKKKRKDKLLTDGNKFQRTKFSQALQKLSEQLFLIMKDRKLKTLLMIDIDASGDVDNIIAHLSNYLSRNGGYKVLIIDANLRKYFLSKKLNISDSPGLTDVLQRKIAFEDSIQNIRSNLDILPAGDSISNPALFLDSSKLADVINTSREIYDLVLVTCANLKNYSDAVILASKTDGAILVVNEGKINRQVAKSLISPLEQSNANIVGAILNNRTYVIPEIIYKLT